jgi:DNA modification methylase
MNKVYFGDCRESLKQMAKEGVKVQTCITSPPYYGLRDYGTGTWVGGDPSCSHKRDSKYSDKTITGHANKDLTVGDAIYKDVCPKCGAVRKDSQIGLEKSPQEFVDSLVEVFSYVWDILEDDGTLWVNLGDTYVGTGDKGDLKDPKNPDGRNGQSTALNRKLDGFRTKNLIGIPWRVAFALQDFGWNLRQDIIWHKPNPMPESVQDRCTKSHEYIFLLTKKPHYYFDNQAIKDPVKEDWGTRDRANGKYHNEGSGLSPHSGLEKSYEMANKRSVWSVNTKPYKGAHFAVYPEELVEPMVLASTKVGDLVLDPFFGSGTTGAVAQKLGRKWVGCELNKDYEPLQFERLKQQALELI